MPPIDEREYYELLGLTPPEESEDDVPEEQRDEAGAPAPHAEGAGDAPPEGDKDDAPEEQRDEEPPEEDGGQPPEPPMPQQPPQRDAEQIRIDAAVQAALAAEREKTEHRLSAFFAKAGLRNPMDGNKVIDSLDAFEAYQQAYDMQQMQRRLKAGQLTAEDLQAAIAATPEMQRLRQQEQARQEQETAARQAAQKAQIDAEMAEIHRLDPTISSLEDILRLPSGAEFSAKVRQGCSFIDAFRLANYERLVTAAAETSKAQDALARSKEHLAPHGKAKGKGAPSIPADVAQMYDALCPGMSAEDKQKHWAKYKAQ